MDNNSWVFPQRRITSVGSKDRTILWNNVYVCYEQTLFGPVTGIRYSNSGMYLGAVSTNQLLLTRVPQSDGSIWNDQSSRVCHSLRFRADDKMVVKTVDMRVVIRSTETNFERFVSGHTRAVRDALFMNNQTLVSGSDDTTVRIWDIISQEELARGTAHTDYVRRLAIYSDTSFFSASYDHTAFLWDSRESLKAPSTTFNVGSPVEDVLYLKGRDLLACTSGDVVMLFDPRKSQEPYQRLANHTKQVTSMAYCPQQMTLITGSLDCRVTFVSLSPRDNMKVVAANKFVHPVTAVDVHPEASEVSVGFSNGGLRVFKVEKTATAAVVDEFGVSDVPFSAEERKERSLQKYMEAIRVALRHFRYQKAIKTALLSQMPDVVLSTLEELQRRGTLKVALANQIDRVVVRLLRFCVKLAGQSKFTDLVVVVIDIILEIYAPVTTTSPFLHGELMKAHRRIGAVLESIDSIQSSIGVMELLVQ